MSLHNHPTVLICDSRGKQLQNQVGNYPDLNIQILSYSGLTLYRSVKLAENEIKTIRPSQIYILSGVNNLTHMNRRTRRVSALSPDKNKIVQQLYDEMNFAYTLLQKMLHNDAKIIFAPITGIWMDKFNGDDLSMEDTQQEVINQAVVDTNAKIIAFNEQKGNKTPWIHSIIHRYFRCKHHFSYDRLDHDGCHLTDEVCAFWMRKLVSAIQMNCD